MLPFCLPTSFVQLSAWILTIGLLSWYLMLVLDTVQGARIHMLRSVLLQAHAQGPVTFEIDGWVVRPVYGSD